MRQYPRMVAMAAAMIVATGCAQESGDPTAPLDLETLAAYADYESNFTDVTALVTTDPSSATVTAWEVEFANNLDGCSVYDISSDFSGKIDYGEGEDGSYPLGVDGPMVTFVTVDETTYDLSIESGYVMTDVFLKQGGGGGEINQWYHFEPGVRSAEGLTTDGHALSHFSVCANIVPGEEETWEGESATGNGVRYANAKNNNWFLVTPAGDAHTLVYGRNHEPAGDLTIEVAGGEATITIELHPGFRFADEEENVKVQPFDGMETPSYVQPGKMQYKFDASGTTFTTDEVPGGDWYGIHANIERRVLE